ncbi:MAG: protein kinase [Planctomyces sp.]|nr:protein kinase [Planctomyces sp.]
MKPSNVFGDRLARSPHVQAACTEFEHLLDAGERPVIADFAARVPDSERGELVLELVAIEIAWRARRGEQLALEEYKETLGESFPQLALRIDPDLSPTSDGTRAHARGGAAYLRLAPLQERQRLGRYRLVHRIGLGAFGEVWLADDPELQRSVAIKSPRSDVEFTRDELERFRAEAQRVAQLRHPHIAGVHDVGREGDRPFVVYEFIDGRTLRSILADDTRPPRRTLLRLFCETCEAIEHAHANDIIHRDIKPGNILVDRDQKPHVVDFGMAKMPSADQSIIQPGMICGTPQYMAPEQAAGVSEKVNRLSDVYALGVVLYEMLTGERPFQSTSSDLLRRIREEAPRAPSELTPSLPGELDAVCLKAMARDQANRFQSVESLRFAIEDFLDTEARPAAPATQPSSASPAGRRVDSPLAPPRDATRWWRQHRSAAAAVAVLVAIAVCSIVWFRSDPISELTAASLLQPDPTTQGARGAEPPGASLTGVIQGRVPFEIVTAPAGAEVVVWGLDPYTNEPDPGQRSLMAGVTPGTVELLPGSYLVVVRWPDGTFHEVYRLAPSMYDAKPFYLPHQNYSRLGAGFRWSINAPPPNVTEGMVTVSGIQSFQLGATPDRGIWMDLLQGFERVSDFLVDPHEASWDDTQRVLGRMPLSFEWWNQASPPGDMPALGWWNDAVWYAEKSGKRLLTEVEFEYLASNRGHTSHSWGDDRNPVLPSAIQGVAAETIDVTMDPPGIRNLLTNVGEWTSSVPRPLSTFDGEVLTLSPGGAPNTELHVVRGLIGMPKDSWDLLNPETYVRELATPDWRIRGAAGRQTAGISSRHGFRGARSARPRWEVEDVLRTAVGTPEAPAP